MVTAIGAFPWSRLDSTSPHTNTSNFRLRCALVLARRIHTQIPPPLLRHWWCWCWYCCRCGRITVVSIFVVIIVIIDGYVAHAMLSFPRAW